MSTGISNSLWLAIAVAVLALAACGEARPRARRLPDGSRLIQKKEYQALYGPDGRLQRVLHDSDGDGVAEAIVFYRVDGTPEGTELDTNGDHVIDRWETLRPDDTVDVLAFDDDGDGRVDRTEYAAH